MLEACDGGGPHLLPGIPASFPDELRKRSGLDPLPVVDAASPPAKAAELFRSQGIVAIRGALGGELLARLKTKCESVMEEIIRHDPRRLGSRGPLRYSFGGSSSTGAQLHHAEWAALVDLPAVTAVLDEIWGSTDYACHTAGGDFCLAGAPGHQSLHADAWFPGCEAHDAAPRVAVNFLVDDQTPLNGPLRVVPGTHRQAFRRPSRERNTPRVEEEPDEWVLSTMCPLPAGTALVRDLRLWHGGTPNLTTAHRAMPNVEFTAPWLLQKAGAAQMERSMPYELWEGLSKGGKHLARFLRAERGRAPAPRVEFDIPLGGCGWSRDFFNGVDLAPFFAVCRDALPLSGPGTPAGVVHVQP